MRKLKRISLLLVMVLFVALFASAQSGLAHSTASLWLHTARSESAKPEKRTFHLCFGDFPHDKGLDNGRIWLNSPDGSIEELVVTGADKHQLQAVTETKYHGLHTALALYEYEVESPQGITLVRNSAKYQLHRCGGLKIKEKTGEFPVELPLEIVPVTKITMPSLREGDDFSLQVLYRGKPLVNTPICAMTEQGWARSLCTDSQGKLTLRLIKDMAAQPENRFVPERYLFRVEYKEPSAAGKAYKNIRHIATYSLDVYPSPMEWQSKSWAYLTVMVTVIVIGGVVALRRRKR